MVLWCYQYDGDGFCYYDDQEEDVTWNLPPGTDYEPQPLDTSNHLTKRKVEKAMQKVVSKRATALRLGLQNYEKRNYAEARRNFAVAIRYGLRDDDVHYKDVHACMMVWQAKPTPEGLESCRQAFQWLLQNVPSSQSAETLFELCKLYTCAGSYHLALELLNSMEVSFPGSPVSGDGQLLAATILAYLGASQPAVYLFELLCDDGPPGLPKDAYKLLTAWVEMVRGEKLTCLGYCEEGLRLYIQRMYETDDPNKSRLGYKSPFDWFKDPRIWVETGRAGLSRWKNYLLGRICYMEAVKRGDRSEKTYLRLYDCQVHLSMHEEALNWLSQGFVDNRLSMEMRAILQETSEYWQEVFRVQEAAAVRIQALGRRILSLVVIRELLEEKAFIKRQEELRKLNVKWQMRRIYCTYFDRRKKKAKYFRVTKRDFFGLWKGALGELKKERRRSAMLIQRLFFRILAKRRVEQQWKYRHWLMFVEAQVVALARRYSQRRACRAFRKVIWLVSLKPHVVRIQTAFRLHKTRKEIDKRKHVMRLMMQHCFRLEGTIFRLWSQWARESRGDRMATRLQSLARGRSVRNRVKKLVQTRRAQQDALVRLVSHAVVDLFFSRWYNRAQDVVERRQAVKVQCMARNHLARRALDRQRHITAGVDAMIEARRVRTLKHSFVSMKQPWMRRKFSGAVTIIQCMVRCYLAIRKVERVRAEVEARQALEAERQRRRTIPVAKRALKAWWMVTRRENKRRHAAAVVIQSCYRGHRTRKRCKFIKYWQRRARRRDKKKEQLEAGAAMCGAKVYTRLAMKLWRRYYFVSRQATLIQCHYRGMMTRRDVAGRRERRRRQRVFVKRCMAVHDTKVPWITMQRWREYVRLSRAAERIQAGWFGRLGRMEAREMRAARDNMLKKLNRLVLSNDQQWAREGMERWKALHQAICKATAIQARYRGHLTYVMARKRRKLCEAFATTCMQRGVERATVKMKANIILQSCFRRERAYRRCRVLSEALYVGEEKAAAVAGRSLHLGIKRNFERWKQEAVDHRRRLVATQAWIRAKFASRLVSRRRARMAEIQRHVNTMAARRRGRWLRACFKALEGELVDAAVEKLALHISLQANPQSSEVVSMADKMRRPGAPPPPSPPAAAAAAPMPPSGRIVSRDTDGDALDLLPFLADGKIPPDLYSKGFVTARYHINQLGVLEWKRYEGLTFREKVWLLWCAPTVVVEGLSNNHHRDTITTSSSSLLDDLAACLGCIAAHGQRSRLSKLVCSGTRLPKDLEAFFAHLRGWTDISSLCLADVPVSLSQARALGSVLMEVDMEELVLERNHLCNAGLALICRAAQVKQSLVRLRVKGNAMDQSRAGQEVGTLLFHSAKLKGLALSDCHMTGAALQALTTQALSDPSLSQCRLRTLDLSNNPLLSHDAIVALLHGLTRMAHFLVDEHFVTTLDFSSCSLKDRVIEPLLELLMVTSNTSHADSPPTGDRRCRVSLINNLLSEAGARALLTASDACHALEVNLLGNEAISMPFLQKAMLSEGRALTKQLERVVMADMLLQRPQSPFHNYYRAPPLLWA